MGQKTMRFPFDGQPMFQKNSSTLVKSVKREQ